MKSMRPFSVSSKANNKKQKEDDNQYSSLVGYSFSLNFIIGVGILGLPWQFYNAGYVLAIILLFIILLVSFITSNYIIDCMARAEGLMSLMEQIDSLNYDDDDLENNNKHIDIKPHNVEDNVNNNNNNNNHYNDNNNNININNESVSENTDEDINENKSDESNANLEKNNDKQYDSVTDIYNILIPYYRRHLKKKNNNNNDNVNPNILYPEFVITNRKIELNEIIGLFFGTVARRIYEVILLIYVIGINWGYTTVFGTALIVLFGINGVSGSCSVPGGIGNSCEHLYWIYVAIYAGIVIVLSMMNFGEQKYFQIVLTVLRFVLIIVVIVTSILLIYSDFKPEQDGKYVHDSNLKKPHYGSGIVLFNPSGIFPFISICAFASIFHQGIPSVAQPIRDKQNLIYVFLAVCVTCFVLYSVFSICVILYFGAYVQTPASLNWAFFPGFSENEKHSVWVKIISYLVVLFPALDVCSTFPLNTITLANNLSFALFHRSANDPKIQFSYGEILMRIILCIIPLIGGFFIPQFNTILQFTGCIGLIVAFIFPAVIEFKSKQICQHILQSKDKKTYWTMYTTWYCHDVPVVMVFFFGIGVVILALYYAFADVLK